ncbi:hypothetical protein ACWEOS_25780 [Micromonospora taraxaci]
MTGRAAAAALTQQWARTIERHGHPAEGGQPTAPDRRAPTTV